MMKKILVFFLLTSIICPALQHLYSQEEEREVKKENILEELKKIPLIYSPEGRRDPFKDLLTGAEVEEKSGIGGPAQMSIDDVNLLGIVKAKGKYTAIIKSPQGFPFYIKVGTKLSDGTVLSISESRVVFRKTRQQGVPLFQPRNIVKELNPEER